jgi:hypothetical protein
MLPKFDAVPFRVEEADKLALPLGVCSDGQGRGFHAVLVQPSDDCVDVVDPVVDDVTLAGLARIAGHDREHQVLVLLGAIELAVVHLDVVGALVGEVTKFPTEMAPIPLRSSSTRQQPSCGPAVRQSLCAGERSSFTDDLRGLLIGQPEVVALQSDLRDY